MQLVHLQEFDVRLEEFPFLKKKKNVKGCLSFSYKEIGVSKCDLKKKKHKSIWMHA